MGNRKWLARGRWCLSSCWRPRLNRTRCRSGFLCATRHGREDANRQPAVRNAQGDRARHVELRACVRSISNHAREGTAAELNRSGFQHTTARGPALLHRNGHLAVAKRRRVLLRPLNPHLLAALALVHAQCATVSCIQDFMGKSRRGLTTSAPDLAWLLVWL
jgi:hypothetical protein